MSPNFSAGGIPHIGAGIVIPGSGPTPVTVPPAYVSAVSGWSDGGAAVAPVAGTPATPRSTRSSYTDQLFEGHGRTTARVFSGFNFLTDRFYPY